MATLLRQTFDLVCPPTCPLCGDRLPERPHHPLCQDCDRALPHQPPPFCRRCGASLPGRWDAAVTCRACLEQPRAAFDRLLAPFTFTGGVRQALHLVKYQGRRRLAAHVARTLSAFARRHLREAPLTAVLPVPLHWQRLWRRGFNQAAWFAQPVAEELGLPLQTRWLARRRPTPSQTTLNRAERLANLEHAFGLTAAATAAAGGRVLLVDDVVTTGATVEACARVLREGGAETVTVLAVARTPLQEDSELGTRNAHPPADEDSA